MPTCSPSPEPADLLVRLRRVLSTVELECQCRTVLHGALDGFSELEAQRRSRHGLRSARSQRDRIAARLPFLDELDELTEYETDRTVFEELALLFEEIARTATDAAQVLRHTADERNRRTLTAVGPG